MRKTWRMAKNTSRIEAVDGLRGLAVILVVLICHFIGDRFAIAELDQSGVDGLFASAIDLSMTGVHLFFIISGFLLGGILLDNRNADRFFSTFYMRRLIRILPLYFGFLLLFYILSPALDARFAWLTEGDLPIWSYGLFMQNNAMAAADSFGGNWLAPTWSLAVEEQFYIILPFLIFYAPPRLLPKILLGAVLLAPVLRAVAGLGISGAASIVLLTSCMDALCYGILAACILRTATGRKRVQASLGVLGWMAWLLPLLALLMDYFGDALDIGARVIGSFWLMTTGFTALLLYVTQHQKGWLHRLLLTGWLRWIGVRCYAIYLFHQAIMGLLGGFLLGRSDFLVTDLSSFCVWLGAIVAILALAALSWRLVERPLIAFGHQWRYRPRTAAPMPADPGYHLPAGASSARQVTMG